MAAVTIPIPHGEAVFTFTDGLVNPKCHVTQKMEVGGSHHAVVDVATPDLEAPGLTFTTEEKVTVLAVIAEQAAGGIYTPPTPPPPAVTYPDYAAVRASERKAEAVALIASGDGVKIVKGLAKLGIL